MKKAAKKLVALHASEHRKNLVKLLQNAGRRLDRWQVFSDFLQMTALSISNSDKYFLATNKETWDKREARYLEIIGKYQKDEQQLFPQMFAELVLELDEQVECGRFVDVLGEIFHELEFHNKWKGQFFTPQHICDMMGKFVLDENSVKKNIDTYGFVSINEPCSGAGAMIYGFMNAFREAGFNHSQQVLVYANDVDERCVWMTYIQCSLYGFPAVVTHQNTLSQEVFGEPWYSPVYGVEMWRYKENRAHRINLREREYEDLMAIL